MSLILSGLKSFLADLSKQPLIFLQIGRIRCSLSHILLMQDQFVMQIVGREGPLVLFNRALCGNLLRRTTFFYLLTTYLCWLVDINMHLLRRFETCPLSLHTVADQKPLLVLITDEPFWCE